MHHFGILRFSLAIGVSLFVLSDRPALADQVLAKVTRDSNVYREASSSSESLGRYRAGMSLKIEFPAMGEWYTVYFSRPFKGTTIGWINVRDVKPIGAVPKKKAGAGTRSKWLSVGATMSSASPASLQATLSETVTSVSLLNLNVEYGSRFKKSLAWSIGASKFSFKKLSELHPKTSETEPGDEYSASGFTGMAGIHWLPVTGPRFTLSLGLGLGFTFASTDNIAASLEMVTSNIITPVIAPKLSMRRVLFGNFALEFNAGYQIMNLSSVQVILRTSDEPVITDMALSGLFYGGGISFLF